MNLHRTCFQAVIKSDFAIKQFPLLFPSYKIIIKLLCRCILDLNLFVFLRPSKYNIKFEIFELKLTQYLLLTMEHQYNEQSTEEDG